MIKLIFCLRRRPELTQAEFLKRWDQHGELGTSLRANLPQLKRYVQCRTLEGPWNDRLSEERGGTSEPYDGVTEVWFDDLEAIGTRVEGTEKTMARLLADEAEFLDFSRCAIFLTEEREIFN